MRKLTLLILLLVGPYCLAQDYDFTHLNGLRSSDGCVLFNACGYDIFILNQSGDIHSPETLSKVKDRLKIKNTIEQASDDSLGVKNRILTIEPEQSEIPTAPYNEVLYLIQKGMGEVSALFFSTAVPRDTLFERVFIHEWLVDGLELFISDSWVATQIYMAGEWIKLGTACQWRGPNNVYFGGGQVSWSEFSTLERAIQDRDTRIRENRGRMQNILLDEEIQVLFEGVPTTARRVVYISVDPKMGSVGMPLVVYYIAEEVRGHYISCILSNYRYNRNDYELALLLREFMVLTELPPTALNPFDVVEYDTFIYDEIESQPDAIHMFEFGVSMWNPMGRLRNQFGTGMGVSMVVGLPINRTMTVDMNVQFQIPFKKHEFPYHYKEGGSDMTKTNAIPVMGARLRKQHNLKKNLNLNTYAGIGLGVISTELEKGENSDGTKKYHTAYTADFLVGASLRYKWGGLFAEFHYTPFGLSDHLDKDFGGPSFNLGIFVAY